MAKGELVTCLCLTYGRFQYLRDALTCFLAQDSDLGRLLIWNFHEVPITLAEEYRNVELINQPHKLDNIDGWMAGLEMVRTPLVRIWQDDDLYLPWTVSQITECIGDYVAYMPVGRYHYRRDYGGIAHYFEDQKDGSSVTYRTEVAKAYGIDGKDILRIPPGILILPNRPFWVLTCSDYEGGDASKAHSIQHKDRKVRDKLWRSRQRDTGDGVPLTPGDIRPHLEVLKRCCPELPGELAKHGF